MSAPKAPIDPLTTGQLLRERAYRDGFRAGRDGVGRETNPYGAERRTTYSDAQRASWDLGWTTAQRGP